MCKETTVHNYLKDFVFEESGNMSLFSPDNKTITETYYLQDCTITKFINEFWTSKQRKASSIHEISYRACFKPQLPRFFINLLTHPEEVIYDPFSGRGTTTVEAGLLNRKVISNDINPLSKIFTLPRLGVPGVDEVINRLNKIPLYKDLKADLDLSMFYHPDTESEIVSIKNYLEERKQKHKEDNIDCWIRMVATNRLTGHSRGFFSVYTLPPNQAVSPERQIKINEKRNQKPGYKNTKEIIIGKTKSLLKNLKENEIINLKNAYQTGVFLEKDARNTEEIPGNTVKLTVTSPPFLDIVQYSKDNWLRCWFNNINTKEVEKQITMSRTVEEWSSIMQNVFFELYRITKPGGWVAFEVGEVKNGKINLEEYIVPTGIRAGFKCTGILINLQEFTKTSNIWGVKNNNAGTNTNRIVLFYKE